MSSRDEIQLQLSKLLASAISQGHSLEDIIPEEVQEHFSPQEDLDEALAHIIELESREKALKADNRKLQDRVKELEGEIADQPGESKLQLQLAKRQIDFQTQIAEAATERAERYQRKLSDVTKKLAVLHDSSQNIERLEAELQRQQNAYWRLVSENAKAAELAQTQHARDQSTIQDLTAQIRTLTEQLNAVELESEEISETYTSIINTLESDSSSSRQAANNKATMLCLSDKRYSAIISEVIPLTRFMDRMLNIVSIYQWVFHTLADQSSSAMIVLPKALDVLMDNAADDLFQYQNVNRTLQADGVPEEAIRVQLDGIANSAGHIYNSLDSIKDDVGGFLLRLRNDADAAMAIKGLSGVMEKMKRLSLRS